MFDAPHLSPMLQAVCMFCGFALLVTGGICVYRITIGPRAADRTVAFDTLSMVFMGIICIACMMQDRSLYFDAVWILTLVGFIGSAAVARYLERGRLF